jgi:ferredoxin-nitrate reductase
VSAASVRSVCCYCGVGCGIVVTRDDRGRVTVAGDPDHPVNRGQLCSKGRNLHHTVNDRSDRILRPRLRDTRDGPWREVTWDEAMDRIARELRRVLADHGPRAAAFYVSGQCLTEEYYAANKLVKGFLGSNNIDTNSRLCMSSAVTAYKLTLGEDAVPGCYEDVDLADCWLVAGANPAWCHPILWRRVEARRQGPSPGRLIVIDPRRTQTAADADLHLALRPGTDALLFRALARLLIEQGFVNAPFVDDHVEGWDEFRDEVLRHPVEQDAELCGLEVADLVQAARWIGESRGFVSLWAMGLNQSQDGVDKNLGLLALHLITGRIGTPGNTPFSLTGQPNAMGGREVGGMATMLPAHRDLGNPDHRAEVARAWGVGPLDDQPGLTATEMVEALTDGRLKAVWVTCTNPAVSLPDQSRAAEAFGRAELVVVQEISERADTLDWADVVLPAATWAEKSGTMTNSERRVSRLEALVPPPGEALADVEILHRLAQAMGWGDQFPSDPEILWKEHAALTRGTRIDQSGLDPARWAPGTTYQWPVAVPGSPGTPRLFTDGVFYRPNGRAKLFAPAHLSLPAPTDRQFPLVLTSGRLRDQWHTMTRTGKVARLGLHEPECFLEIHPADAGPRGIADGQLVEIASRQGRAKVRARVTDTIRAGVVFLPMHWGRLAGNDGALANGLTSRRVDRRSQQPDLKYEPVEVVRPVVKTRSIVVVGAGTAAAAFVQELRKDESADRITVFSDEPEAFYHRLRLPHYLEGTQTWEALAIWAPTEKAAFGVALKPVRAAAIDRTNRIVRGPGHEATYDVLVLAPGSRPRFPEVPGAALAGVFGLRNRADAEALLARGGSDRPVVVCGGGILAVETAGALHQRGWPVTLVHRGEGLLERLFDAEGSRLVTEAVRRTGLPVILGDGATGVEGTREVEGVRLASDRVLPAAAVVFATGTVPRVDLGLHAGLHVDRGIVADSRLRTSDPSILVLGEAAQVEGRLWGLAAAAEAQGRAAARSLMGDPFGTYRPAPPVNLLKFEGVEAVSGGTWDDPNLTTVTFRDEDLGVYKRVWLAGEQVRGFVLVGDRSDLADLKGWLESGAELGEARARLLRSGPGRSGGTGRLVCSCLSVRESALHEAVTAGAETIDALKTVTGAGTGCGSCRSELAAYLPVLPEPNPH